MVKGSLGNKSIKCVVDEDECIFTCDMEVLLSSLTIEHPVGELIYQALKSHKEQFGEGVRTFMFMIARIAKAVSQLEDLGIRSSASLSVIQEVINELAHQVQQICISVKSTSNTEMKEEVKSKHSSPQKDGFNIENITVKPVSDGTSGESSKATSIYLEKSSSHSAPFLFDSNQSCLSTAESRYGRNSSKDQSADLKSSDYTSSSGSTVEEVTKHQPPSEWNCPSNDFPISQTQEPPDSVVYEHLSPGIVMESDPVLLKMSDLCPKDENEDGDIDWYFDDNFVRGEDEKQMHQKSFYNVQSEKEKTTNNVLDHSNSNKSGSSLSTEVNHQENFSHENTLEENIQLEERRHPNLTDGDQHDSDFEDCFDDLENRKQVVVVVEQIEDFNSSNPVLHLSEDKSAIMKRRMAHNIHKHFAPSEFETPPDVPSLNDCQSDKEFSDCFEDAIGCDSQVKLCHNPKTHLHGSEPQVNQLRSGLKQDKNIFCLKSSETSTCIPSMITSDAGHNFSPSTSFNHLSELDKLNSILSSINIRKSQNVKEILVSSRHKVDKSYLNEFNDKMDVKTGNNSEERLYCDSMYDATEEGEIPSLKDQNHHDESKTSLDASRLDCDAACSPLHKNNTSPDTVETATESSSLPSGHTSELEKLNSILSSINVKRSVPQTRQILLSSRHCLKEDELIENCPHTDIASKDATDLDRTNTRSELSTSSTFEETSGRVVGELEQQQRASHNPGEESFRNIQFDLESLALPSTGSNSCVTMADVMMRKKLFITLPLDLHSLTRGHEDIVEVIEKLYSNTTNSLADEDKNRLNPHLTHCVSIQSPKSSKTAVEGLVVSCRTYVMENLRTKFDCHLNALLINGDLMPTHRHKGYKPVIAKKNLIKSPSDMDSQNKEVLWASGIVKKMKQLDVAAVFIRGNTTSIMSDVCLSEGIVPLTNTSYHALSIMCQQMKTDMLCYAEDASKSNVCKVCLEPLNPLWMDVMEENHCLLVSNLSHVKTIVLSEPCALAAQMSEEKFWKSFHRVSNAICDGMILPGGGVTEIWCSEQIKQMMSSLIDFTDSDEQLLKVTILETLADVFHDFADTVKHNTGTAQEDQGSHLSPHRHTSTCKKDSDPTNHSVSVAQNGRRKSLCCEVDIQDNPQVFNNEAMTRSKDCLVSASKTSEESNGHYKNVDIHFDPFCSKISAWRSAVDVVSVVNSLDCLIITGASDKDLDFDGLLL